MNRQKKKKKQWKIALSLTLSSRGNLFGEEDTIRSRIVDVGEHKCVGVLVV